MNERTEIVGMLVNAGTNVNKETIAGKETIYFMRDTFLIFPDPMPFRFDMIEPFTKIYSFRFNTTFAFFCSVEEINTW